MCCCGIDAIAGARPERLAVSRSLLRHPGDREVARRRDGASVSSRGESGPTVEPARGAIGLAGPRRAGRTRSGSRASGHARPAAPLAEPMAQAAMTPSDYRIRLMQPADCVAIGEPVGVHFTLRLPGYGSVATRVTAERSGPVRAPEGRLVGRLADPRLPAARSRERRLGRRHSMGELRVSTAAGFDAAFSSR